MKYKHDGLVKAKNALLVRLSYIVTKMNANAFQEEIANKIGCSTQTVSNIKNCKNRNISFDRLLIIAERLNVDYELKIISKGRKKAFELIIDDTLFSEVFKNNTFKYERQKSGRVSLH